MSNIVGLDLNIDKNYLEKAIKDTVMMGIVEGLNKDEVVSGLVNSVLSTKVNSNGEISRYSSDNNYSLLEFYLNKFIKEEIINVFKEYTEENRESIRNVIKKELSKQKTVNKFAEIFTDCVSKNLESTWKTNIEVNFNKHEDIGW